MKNDPVVVKLMNGETFIAVNIESTTTHATFENPISIRVVVVPGQGGVVEKTITSPYCSLTDETVFSFRHEHILFVKPVQATVREYYLNLVATPDGVDEARELHDSRSSRLEDTDVEISKFGYLIIPELDSIH